jgi:hypothetical protein
MGVGGFPFLILVFRGAFSGWPCGEPRRERGGGPASGWSLLVGRFANRLARPLLTRVFVWLGGVALRVSRRTRELGGKQRVAQGAGHRILVSFDGLVV